MPQSHKKFKPMQTYCYLFVYFYIYFTYELELEDGELLFLSEELVFKLQKLQFRQALVIKILS